MKDENLIEYYTNGRMKHEISYFDNGGKDVETFYDENGLYHRENDLPDYQQWYENGQPFRKIYTIHGYTHNNNNPANIIFNENGKIHYKCYQLKDRLGFYTKLAWMNLIKKI